MLSLKKNAANNLISDIYLHTQKVNEQKRTLKLRRKTRSASLASKFKTNNFGAPHVKPY